MLNMGLAFFDSVSSSIRLGSCSLSLTSLRGHALGTWVLLPLSLRRMLSLGFPLVSECDFQTPCPPPWLMSAFPSAVPSSSYELGSHEDSEDSLSRKFLQRPSKAVLHFTAEQTASFWGGGFSRSCRLLGALQNTSGKPPARVVF